MAFTTPHFLFFFLPLVLCGYWVLPPRLRLIYLLAASFIFYACGEGGDLVVLSLAIMSNYLLVLVMERCQQTSRRLTVLFAAIALNLAFLFAFKYPGMTQWLGDKSGISFLALTPLSLPLGISFFIFQAIAYTVDVYHRKLTSTLNPLQLSLFLSLFPKISAGPIIRHEEVGDALTGPTVNMNDCAYGAKRFILGLGKKLLIADTLAKTTDSIFAIPAGDLTAPLAWLGIICYTLQLYFDFSGYSDMAIGLGRMLGFSFRENFDHPYIAKSVTEFWRRWHISLSTWFRDYLYTPLLYSLMTNKIRQKIALGQYRTNYRGLFCIIIVFTLCGWWHGSTLNFVIWGLLHGILMAAESWKLGKLLKKVPAALSHGYTLLFIMFCWVFFRSPSLTAALDYIESLVGFGSATGIKYNLALYLNSELLLVLLIAFLASMPCTSFLRKHLRSIYPPTITRWPGAMMETAAVMLVFILSLLSVATSTYQPFIYFRF